MRRLVILYGLALGVGSALLQWLDYRHFVHAWSTEFYVVVVALLFALLGAWVGNRLTTRQTAPDFTRNDRAMASLGISARECEVLEMLAAGHANKVIARRLSISPNTVKTHVARLFEKMEVNSRTQAIRKARNLHILP